MQPSITHPMTPAEEAAQAALATVFDCIEHGVSFRLEAGAGAGKTHSLIEALRYVIEKKGQKLLRLGQQVACITYTNVACDEIKSRIDNHPAVLPSTIHAFCWSLIKDFQQFLQSTLPSLKKWPEKLTEVGGVGRREIRYELGYRNVTDLFITVSHDDVLELTVAIMEFAKFRKIMAARFPVIFIDEYQDTNAELSLALEKHFFGTEKGALVGLFGDHWQKIYTTGVGRIEHPALKVISKGANFRSTKTIVDVLNRIRPELPQAVRDVNSLGSVAVYHTNEWSGERRKGGHWDGDLPSEIAHKHLVDLNKRLSDTGWDFSPETTKILMLTHKVLAEEQGYGGIANAFSRNEAFTQKEDAHIEFFVDVLEPVCMAYEAQKYGEMFLAVGDNTPLIQSRSDKARWAQDMSKLLTLREIGTIGNVIDHLRRTRRPRLPDHIERREQELELVSPNTEPDKSSLSNLRKLREVAYQEVIMLTQFLTNHSPFATKHGVKGAEFENVLVVIGRGWSQYNFNQMLEWVSQGVPTDKLDTFERNRNLFYVVCSRPKTRLALLFTQKLSLTALDTLECWFGEANIHPFVVE